MKNVKPTLEGNGKPVSLRFRRFCRNAAVVVATLLLPALWIVTVVGRTTLTPPGWLAVLITLLPYLYLVLLLLYAILLCSIRRKAWLFVLIVSLALSAGIVWGRNIFPKKAQPPSQIRPITVMVWNVQRMGEFVSNAGGISPKVECVAQAIEQVAPDLVALLEITSHQLHALQTRLKLPGKNCIWSDYYGTGQKRFGGLAICVTNQDKPWGMSRRRTLNLPPNWKYLFLEVQTPHHPGWPPLNFLALHIAPPKITDKRVGSIITTLLKGNRAGLSKALKMLKDYGQQVTLQGKQAINALQRIQKFRDPTMIAGDFNSTRDAALHVHLRQELIDTWAQSGFGFGATRYWGDFLPLRIDYIYVTKDFAVHDVQTLAYECSDHFPVVASIFLHATPTEQTE